MIQPIELRVKPLTLGPSQRWRPWMRSAGGRVFASPQTNAHGPRYGAAALAYLIVVILDIAPVQDVIPSHYVPDDEDGTR